MNIHQRIANKFRDPKNSYLVIICLMLIFCFDFFRIVGDVMDSWNMPVIAVYGMVIFLSIIAPLLLIIFGFRRVPTLWGFAIVFILTCPITILIDLVFFSTAPFDLLVTPAYLVGIFIVSFLLSAITAGVTLYATKKKLALLIIILGVTLYLFQVREIVLSFIGFVTIL